MKTELVKKIVNAYLQGIDFYTFHFYHRLNFIDRSSGSTENFTFFLQKRTIQQCIDELKGYFGDDVETFISHITRFPSLELVADFREKKEILQTA